MKNVFNKFCLKIDFQPTPIFKDVVITHAKLLNKEIFEVNFSSKNLIPFFDMKNFLSHLNNNFPYKTKLNFDVSIVTYESSEIKSYLNWIIADFLGDYSLAKMLIESITEVNANGQVQVSFMSEYSLLKIKDKEANVTRIMKKFGFANFKFNFLIISNSNILEKEKQEVLDDFKNANNQLTSFNKNENIRSSKYGFVERQIKDLYDNQMLNKITVKGKIFSINERKTRSGMSIFIISITDYTEAIYLKSFANNDVDKNNYRMFQKNDFVLVSGALQIDAYTKQKTIIISKIKKIKNPQSLRIDDAPEKRVELSFRTRMSTMDGIISPEEIITRAQKWGHKSVAIVDTDSVQSFPELYHAAKDSGVKPIYGVTLNGIDKNNNAVYYPLSKNLLDDEYVVFDLETTGLSPEYNELIEFGAVVVKNNQILTKEQFFIKPQKPVPSHITKITKITNSDLENGINEKAGMKRIIDFIGDKTLVAHNANFDLTFLKTKSRKYNLKDINNPTIDTLITSRIVFPDAKRFRLESVAKKYNVFYDAKIAHRADYDAEILANIWSKQIHDLEQLGLSNQTLLSAYKSDKLNSKQFPNTISVIAKNQLGLKELFQIVSTSLTTNLHGNGRVFLNDLRKNKNILIGSSGLTGKIVNLIFTGSKEQIKNEIAKYDYIEIQPIQNFKHKLNGDIAIEDLQDALKNIILEAKKQGKIVVATGDVRYIDKNQKIYHEIYINSKGLGGIRHYLFKYKNHDPVYPNQNLLTTNEMMEEFSFLNDKNLVKEIVIDNTNYIASLISDIEVIKKDLFTPKIDGADEKLEKIVYDQAYKKYGNPLPEIVAKRIKKEMQPIKKYGFSVIYWISHILVTKSLKDGYLVGSRGSVGSSLVATLAKITEVNPLEFHYLCSHCKYVDFILDSKLNSGYDLPPKDCPKCQTPLDREGQRIPFETFLGFEGNKVPDIDLNFSGDYQPLIHNEVKNIFGDTHSFRAGTISTVAEKTAFGYVRAWSEETNKNLSKAFIEFLAQNVAGTKRTTGQHPGGIIVVPKSLSVEDFCPINFPANDKESSWKTTHFDFHAIHDNVLKLDLLGHDDPTAIRYLEKLTGVNAKKDIPFYDPKVVSLFSSPSALGIKSNDILGEHTGVMGIPEFGTTFVRKMLKTAKVSSFGDLISISGLSHGTDVWTGNMENVIKEEGKTLSELISCRDNIMTDLVAKGLDAELSFEIMEKVRKGKGISSHQEKKLKHHEVEEWYIHSLKQIKYMFPKAHATAYVMMAWRIAWFKLYYPEEYYATYFTTRADVFDLFTIIEGDLKIKEVLSDFKKRKNARHQDQLSNKEIALIPILELVVEALARGVKIGNVDLKKSQANKWIIDENKTLIPPFISIDGLGESVAKTIISARKDKYFSSLEDLKNRTSLNKTSCEKLKSLGALKHLFEQNQISIMDFF